MTASRQETIVYDIPRIGVIADPEPGLAICSPGRLRQPGAPARWRAWVLGDVYV